jgi:hypothetical protein
MNLTKQPLTQTQQSQQQFQKSALAADNKKFNEIKVARKTSFFIPPSQESDGDRRADDEEEEESSDYISEFPDFKKAISSQKAAFIDLKKRKTSSPSSQVSKLNSCNSLTSEVFVSTLKGGVVNQLKRRENPSDDMYKNSKFRPATPKVFNYFPVSFTSTSKKANTNINNTLFAAKSMGNVNFNLGNTSADSNANSNLNQRLPKINPAIKENLLSSRTHTQKGSNKSAEKQNRNLFFPLLINNNNNSKIKNENTVVTNLNSYFDDPNGIFFLQSLSHLSMKNLNQT